MENVGQIANEKPRSIEIPKEIVEFMSLEIAPYIKMHGGVAEILGLSDDGELTIAMKGTCSSCSAKDITLRAHIERAVRRRFPSVLRVRAVVE